VDGHPEAVGGTSASSPAFAGLMSLINEARLRSGKAAMGFLNPFLYKNADAFTDVTKGSNKIGRGGQPLPYGWNCSVGWDPATGLGTPLFDKLLAAAMA
jgi:tripeptidyl-peptidase I